MRKLLALIPLAVAASLLLPATSASAACYGTTGYLTATVCYEGTLDVYTYTFTQCVHTGGDTCQEVEVPFVWYRDVPRDPEVCLFVSTLGSCVSP